MSLTGRSLPAAVVLALAALPSPALACSVCFWGKSNSMAAYVGTAAFLGALPLTLIGGIGLWIRHRIKIQDAQNSQTTPTRSCVR